MLPESFEEHQCIKEDVELGGGGAEIRKEDGRWTIKDAHGNEVHLAEDEIIELSFVLRRREKHGLGKGPMDPR